MRIMVDDRKVAVGEARAKAEAAAKLAADRKAAAAVAAADIARRYGSAVAKAAGLPVPMQPPSRSRAACSRGSKRSREAEAEQAAAARMAAMRAELAARGLDSSGSDGHVLARLTDATALVEQAAAIALAERVDETTCGICLEECETALECEHRQPGGWGHTRCCSNAFHYDCLSTWLNQDAEVAWTYEGTGKLKNNCPHCRNEEIGHSKRRMLGPRRATHLRGAAQCESERADHEALE